MANITELLEYSLESGASDLHLSVGSIPMVRIHGTMKKLQLPKLELSTMEAIKNEVLNENTSFRLLTHHSTMTTT